MNILILILKNMKFVDDLISLPIFSIWPIY